MKRGITTDNGADFRGDLKWLEGFAITAVEINKDANKN
jgi:hypothetical protein